MASRRKRKYLARRTPVYDPNSNSLAFNEEEDPMPDAALFVQAYEADIIRGPRANAAAESLEVFNYDDVSGSSANPAPQRIGDALIRWGGSDWLGAGARPAFPGDEDNAEGAWNDDKDAVWVDRYDARLLLDALPVPTDALPSLPESPTGWSDLPSDSEDTFFFSPDEAEDFRREKRRRLIDQNREERLKARRAEDGEKSEEEEEEEEVWGESDEEPDDMQKELMRRTAAHLLSSPNPAQLEMRILANHGGDKRFAFLRGRWSRAWQILKGRARMEVQAKAAEQKSAGGLGVLAGYGDSDEGSGDESDHAKGMGTVDDSPEIENRSGEGASGAQGGGDAAKEARRARAKEWAEKRRAVRSSAT